MAKWFISVYIVGIPDFKPTEEKDGLRNIGKNLNIWLPKSQLDLLANRVYLITAAHCVIKPNLSDRKVLELDQGDVFHLSPDG